MTILISNYPLDSELSDISCFDLAPDFSLLLNLILLYVMCFDIPPISFSLWFQIGPIYGLLLQWQDEQIEEIPDQTSLWSRELLSVPLIM